MSSSKQGEISKLNIDTQTSERSGRHIDEQNRVVNIVEPYKLIGGETIPTTGLVDFAGQNQSISVFGDMVTAKRVATVAAQFVYGINDQEAESVISGSGAVAIEDENMLALRTGTTPGSTARIQTLDPLQYIPGYQAEIWFTPVYTKPESLTGYCRAGLFDDDDGFWVGYDGPELLVCRRRAGVEHPILREDWNMDKLDGEGPSGILFNADDPDGNVIRIRYGFLGFAAIIFEIMDKRSVIYPFHVIEYPNTSKVTHIANTYLPGRIEVGNGDAAQDVSLKIGSFNLSVVDGDNEEATNRSFSLGAVGLTASGAYNRRPLIAFRNKETYQGPLMPAAKENRIGAILEYLYVQLDGQNKGVLVEIIIIDSDQEVGGATFIDKAATSVLQYSVDPNLDYGAYTGGEQIFAFGIRQGLGSFDRFIGDLAKNLRPGKDAVFALTSDTNLAIDYIFTNAWREKF